MTPIGNSLKEAVQGSIEIGGAMVTPFFRARRSRWGTVDEELTRTYPGDELVPDPKWTADHAITINATPEHVWPWIAQIGQGRGGFYSYQKLENLAGSEIVNTARILDEHQQVRPGDPIRLHVQSPPMTVAIVEEPTTLVLYGDPAGADGSAVLSTSWAFLLLEQPDGTTRLLSRTRYHHADDRRSKLMGGPLLIEPVSFVMERKMLKVIKALVESSQ
jgi:hypothetical protein